ncbi:MAG: GNAT family N-acetyltransferase [Bacteroidota bacterium]|nr:GNAT family N-acetyltransferase [Bacteroidota bacterium]
MNINNIIFRSEVLPEDVENVREIVTSTDFFYDFEIPIAVELVEDALKYGSEKSGYYFLFAMVDGKTVAYTCYGPTTGSVGGFDLFWIATRNDMRGSGIGSVIVEETHKKIVEMGGRFVIAETSSMEKYKPTRKFYLKNHYVNEGEIRDFYKPGDGKVFFVRRFS